MSKISIKIQETDDNYTSAHVVIMKEGKILILKRSKTDEWMPGHYGLPGGKLDPGENLEEAACRECKEEINLNISPKDLKFLPKISKNSNHAFFLTTKFTGMPKTDFEHDDFQWINPNDLSKYKTVPDLPLIISEALQVFKKI